MVFETMLALSQQVARSRGSLESGGSLTQELAHGILSHTQSLTLVV